MAFHFLLNEPMASHWLGATTFYKVPFLNQKLLCLLYETVPDARKKI